LKRWLITMSRDHQDLELLRNAVEAGGGAVSDSLPIPLDRDEQVVEVEGPDDLPEKLKRHPAVRKMSPDSEVELF